jgi:adenosyl cobinamide kinase/adenosyl cobinamide phosphate guanylyltransferase
MTLILITGGARAGKSHFAVGLAQEIGGDRDVCYLATAEPRDDEMRARIVAHRAARPAAWRTLEVPSGVGVALRSLALPAGSKEHVLLTLPPRPSVVLLDCVTMLVSNVLFAQADGADMEDAWPAVEAEINDLLQFAALPGVTMIVVTNEVGLGIVPAHPVARVYRDLLGRANQRLASWSAFVYLVVSGIPLEIKGMQRLFAGQMGDRE